jgi:hypothetical protein
MLWRAIQLGWVLAITAIPLVAQNAPVGFESLADSAILTSQYPGSTFANAIVLSAGITLNEFEFPPHSGVNVASDNGGPITITFVSALSTFSAYFTYSTGLTVQALGAANQLLTTSTSAYSDNEALSGTSGSHPNELLQVSSKTGIYKIVITGSPQGTSFAMDDATLFTACDLNHDGYSNATDAQAIINQALGANMPISDLNGDGVVNVVDVQIVIKAAMGGACIAL